MAAWLRETGCCGAPPRPRPRPPGLVFRLLTGLLEGTNMSSEVAPANAPRPSPFPFQGLHLALGALPGLPIGPPQLMDDQTKPKYEHRR